MTQKKNFSFVSADGRTKIHAVRWMPEQEKPRAILQIVHGMIEYIERYKLFAEYLCRMGYMVVGHDHLGHGRSIQSREEWGFFSEKNPSDTLVADIHHLRLGIQKQYPDVPYYMMGHSMGSYMLRKYLIRHHRNLNGVIIMGTGYVPVAAASFGKVFTEGMARIFGWHHRSKLVEALTFGKSYAKFDRSGKDVYNSWLTRDAEIVREYCGQPQCSFKFTLNGYRGLFEAVSEACDSRNVARYPMELPFFIVSGEEDPVGDAGLGVSKVYEMYQNAGITDVTMKLYPNDRHEILHELDKDVVYDDIYTWMEDHR